MCRYLLAQRYVDIIPAYVGIQSRTSKYSPSSSNSPPAEQCSKLDVTAHTSTIWRAAIGWQRVRSKYRASDKKFSSTVRSYAKSAGSSGNQNAVSPRRWLSLPINRYCFTDVRDPTTDILYEMGSIEDPPQTLLELVCTSTLTTIPCFNHL
jgi:hypothetical protein